MAENLPYEKFFKDLVELDKKQREIRKNQGINDYNILTSVLSEYDEARLHSRMIASFLDSQGYHYQDSLFFDLFMEALGLADFGMDSTNLEVKREYSHMDIYITDGAKHIIIENKIHASDGEAQIQKYVNSIYKQNEELESTDLLVLYLSIDRASPSQISLGNLTIQPDARRDKLMEGDKFKAYFKNINYATHILPWLERCQKEVKNITNLNMAFDQYAQVVRTITHTNERTKMKLTEIFNSNPKYYEVAQKLIKEMSDFKAKKMCEFIKNAKKQLSKKLEKTWECEIYNQQKWTEQHALHVVIKKHSDDNKHPQAAIVFSFEKMDCKKAYFGITTIKLQDGYYENIALGEITKRFAKQARAKAKKFDSKDTSVDEECPWYLTWKYYPEDKNEDTDFIKYILFKEDAVSDFVETIKDYLDDHKTLIDEINALIKPRHK